MSTSFMLNQSLIEAKIVPVYDFNNVTYERKIVIYLLTKTIYLCPIRGGLLLKKNRKYSSRRLLRWARRGCVINIQESEPIPFGYQIIYLTREDLEDLFVGVPYKKKMELIKEIYEINTRKCGGSNVRRWR